MARSVVCVAFYAVCMAQGVVCVAFYAVCMARSVVCVGYTLMRRRSNHHDVAGDIGRDITRKRKIQLALGITPASLQEYEGDSDAPPDDSPLTPAKRWKLRRLDVTNPLVDGVRFGTRGNSTAYGETAIGDVDAMLPTARMLPLLHLRKFAFADRLGWFLTEGAAMPSGAYPRPDGDVIISFKRMQVASAHGHNVPFVRADPHYHGRPAYSFVSIEAGAGDGQWFAQVLFLFTARFRGEKLALALVVYLEEIVGRRACPNKRTFRWYSRFPDCVSASKISGVVRMISVEVDMAQKFVLLD